MKDDRRQASELWRALDPRGVIEDIIETRAWEPLGYSSFSEAWPAEMADITLPAELRAHVVYQMLADGTSVDDIACAVKGVGRDRVESLKRQRLSGVPPGDASLRT